MNVVLIDNYDSFTHNLAQLLGALGASVQVVRNDALDRAGVAALRPSHLVLSPGPGSPDRARDFGVCADVIRELSPRVPTLGVCLGHQGIVHHLGGQIGRAPAPRHGKVSAVRHDASRLFAGMSATFEAMRYHSLAALALPPCLRPTATSLDDGVVMAVEHTAWPLWGVQFHPESVGTPAGRTLLDNFLRESAP